MLRRRSSISFTNTSRIKERHLKTTIQKLLPLGKYLGIILLIAVCVYGFSQFLIIKNITCQTNEGVCSPELSNLFNYLKGKNTMFVNKKTVTETIKNIFPIGDLKYNFRFPNQLDVEITGWQSSIPMVSYQLSSYPAFSMDQASLSTESGSWRKPSLEIDDFLADKEARNEKLWAVGQITPDSKTDTNIRHLFVENPTQDMMLDFYKIIILSKKYLENPQITIIGSRIFLSQVSQPDIIINVPADLGEVELALQSIDYLYTIKKDAKVIDLSFKHPIIK